MQRGRGPPGRNPCRERPHYRERPCETRRRGLKPRRERQPHCLRPCKPRPRKRKSSGERRGRRLRRRTPRVALVRDVSRAWIAAWIASRVLYLSHAWIAAWNASRVFSPVWIAPCCVRSVLHLFPCLALTLPAAVCRPISCFSRRKLLRVYPAVVILLCCCDLVVNPRCRVLQSLLYFTNLATLVVLLLSNRRTVSYHPTIV